jgi:hypothetical protein
MEFPDKEQVNEQSKTDEPKAKMEIQSFFDSYKKKIDNIKGFNPNGINFTKR